MPPPKFNGIITTAATAHGASRMADCRLVMFGAFRCESGSFLAGPPVKRASDQCDAAHPNGDGSDDDNRHRRDQILPAQDGLRLDDRLTAHRYDDRDDLSGRKEIGERKACRVSNEQAAWPHGAIVSVAGRERLGFLQIQCGRADAQCSCARLGDEHLGAVLVDVTLAHHVAVGERRIERRRLRLTFWCRAAPSEPRRREGRRGCRRCARRSPACRRPGSAAACRS